MAKDVSLVRIKADTNDYERNIRKAQKTWNDFTKGLGVNISKFTGVGAAIAGVTAALKVAKDAFFQNEQNLDEWGRVVKSSESIYTGFLNALNSGNISGYLQNINNIVKAAREAYDAMDALGTFNAFNQINQERARTGFTEAMANFREGTGKKEDVQAAADALKEELKKRQEKEYDAYVKAIYDKAETLGIGGAALQRILEGSNAQYEQYKNLGLTGKGMALMGGGYEAVAANDQERIGEALRKLNDTELESLQALGAQAQRTATEIESVNKQMARVLRGNSGSTGGSGGKGGKTDKETYIPLADSIDAQIAKVKELQDAFNKTADQSVRGRLIVAIDEATNHLNFMQGKGIEPLSSNISGSLTEHLGIKTPDFSKVKIEGDDLDKLQELANAGKQAETSWDAALGSISGLGSALASIEDPAVKVLGIIAQAIATVALSFAQALSKDTKLGVFGWIAAAAAGTAAMVSTISAIKSATAGSYEQGGIVPGNSYSGDNLTANVNSGEVILSMAQSKNLATILRQQNSNNKSYQPSYVSGEQIWVAMNRYLKRSGQGEVLTWKS